jgi:hypothetical protein
MKQQKFDASMTRVTMNLEASCRAALLKELVGPVGAGRDQC